VERSVYSDEHRAFAARVRAFFEGEVVPDYPAWEERGRPPRWFWRRAGELGILGIGVPTEYGGMAFSTFKHSAIVTEETQRRGLSLGGLRLQVDICMPYFLSYATEEQKRRWLPGMTSGELVCALGMTEPGVGSDMKAMSTKAVRDGDAYVVNGAKTFISNGLEADLVILAVKTNPKADRRGISLLIVEATTDGFERGRKLEKIGLRTQDLAELAFTDMVVPTANLLGEENRGFEYLSNNLAQERLSIAVNAQASATAALEHALAQVKHPADQVTKFALAGCKAEVEAGQALIDRAIERHVEAELDPATPRL
jgi:alkylation response protein AidB-like acyl-CoA dehydrogenase